MTTISSSFTKDGKQPHPKEAEIQIECWAYLSTLPCTLPPRTGDGTVFIDRGWSDLYTLQDFSYAVPNGAYLAGGSLKRRAMQISKLKAQGLVPGVSDIVIARPSCRLRGGVYHGAYIEIKRDRKAYGGPKGQLRAVSDEQRNWARKMYLAGYYVYVAYGVEDFKFSVQEFLRGAAQPSLDFNLIV